MGELSCRCLMLCMPMTGNYFPRRYMMVYPWFLVIYHDTSPAGAAGIYLKYIRVASFVYMCNCQARNVLCKIQIT